MLKVTLIDFRKKEVNTIDYSQYIGTRYSYDVFGDVEVMQSTGLKDKKGVEIFEGDIIECCRYETNVIFVIVVKDIKNLPMEMFGSNLNWRSVIGNIHENPELLKEGA